MPSSTKYPTKLLNSPTPPTPPSIFSQFFTQFPIHKGVQSSTPHFCEPSKFKLFVIGACPLAGIDTLPRHTKPGVGPLWGLSRRDLAPVLRYCYGLGSTTVPPTLQTPQAKFHHPSLPCTSLHQSSTPPQKRPFKIPLRKNQVDTKVLFSTGHP